MEQSPSCEASRSSASQEMLRILWNPTVHYNNHKNPPLVTILSHIDPVHSVSIYFLKFCVNIILPSTPSSSKWSLSLMFPHQKPCMHLHSLPYVPHALPISFFSCSSVQYLVRSILNKSVCTSSTTNL